MQPVRMACGFPLDGRMPRPHNDLRTTNAWVKLSSFGGGRGTRISLEFSANQLLSFLKRHPDIGRYRP